MSVKHIQCVFDAEHVLTPSTAQVPNSTIATVTFDDSRVSGRTAAVSWAGSIRAFLTFAPSGNQVISYTLAYNDQATQKSIENIIPFI